MKAVAKSFPTTSRLPKKILKLKMKDNLQIDTINSAAANSRACQHANAINAQNSQERNNNNNNTVSTSQLHKTEDSTLQHHHSLSIMPPYRYANSESSSAISFSLLPLTRRRCLQRQTCLFCIIAAFMFGLVLGVFVPLLDLSNVFNINISSTPQTVPPMISVTHNTNNNALLKSLADLRQHFEVAQRTRINRTAATATSAELNAAPLSPFTVAFINERQVKIETADILSDSAPTSAEKFAGYALHKSVNKRDYQQMRQNEQEVLQQTAEKRVPKLLHGQKVLQRPNVQKLSSTAEAPTPSIIRAHIYWGDLVERALPQGFSAQDTRDWNAYVASQTAVQRLEQGCGRMQNRLLIFSDGTRACARYRQNTDQIQGELFSFYLGRLLNMSNLAPSAVLTVNVESEKWSNVVRDITQAQWKQMRPVVLTRWLPNLEPAGIPQPFQPLDRHLNKYDVWNITTSLMAPQESDVNSKQTNPSYSVKQLRNALDSKTNITITPNSLALERLVELAQWSDLIVFDYLIANLDRVVNNLYNYQWNAEIMAAPAHNLACQSSSQLLIFLDNESGLLHGYRLLKKYEAYHGLLLNNLCVFREPTIRALRQLREAGAGRKLRELFEQTTSEEVRDVLPTLPDKSIKILIDRIDRVLGQVDNCKQLMNAR
ncbi:extracellular serine/threonine protein kinase four-jointed [Eurosta solidaginis]|uniref:extracellular serine/threonine protein kinase four-jointed n=1 Tax=Eurosta solidaginis TaxID=178769 RepID=UPI003531033C